MIISSLAALLSPSNHRFEECQRHTIQYIQSNYQHSSKGTHSALWCVNEQYFTTSRTNVKFLQNKATQKSSVMKKCKTSRIVTM